MGEPVQNTTNDSIGMRQAGIGCFKPWLVLETSGVFVEEQMQFSPPQAASILIALGGNSYLAPAFMWILPMRGQRSSCP